MFFRRLSPQLSARVCEVSKTNLSSKSRKLLLFRVCFEMQVAEQAPHLPLHQLPHCASVGSRDCPTVYRELELSLSLVLFHSHAWNSSFEVTQVFNASDNPI